MEFERLMMALVHAFIKRPILASLFVVLVPEVWSQELSRLRVDSFAEEIEVSYTLKTSRPLEVQLFYSENDGYSWNGPLQFVTGDVGGNIGQGKKKIVWNFAEEVGELVGDRFRFKVKSSQHYGFRSKFRDGNFHSISKAILEDFGGDLDMAAFRLRQVSGWNSMETKAPSGNYSFEMHHVLQGAGVNSSVDLKQGHHRPVALGMLLSAVLPGAGIPYVTYGDNARWTMEDDGRRAKKGNGNFWVLAFLTGTAVLCHNLEIDAYNTEMNRFGGTEQSASENALPYRQAKFGAGGLAGFIYSMQLVRVLKWHKAHKGDVEKFVARFS